MATTHAVYLQGGPCNGQTHHYPDAQIADTLVTCGGVLYQYNGDSRDPYVFVAKIRGADKHRCPSGTSGLTGQG